MSVRRAGLHGARDSLRIKLAVSVFVMTLPLIAMLLYNNFYAIGVVRGQVSDSYTNTLSLYMNQIDAGLNDVDSYMNSIVGNGYDMLLLSRAATDEDYYTSKIYVFNKLTKDIALYRSVESFFVYEEQRDEYMNIPAAMNLTNAEHEEIQSFMIELIRQHKIPKGSQEKKWRQYRIGSADYLVDIVQFDHAYLGAWMRTDKLKSPLQSLDLGEGGEILLTGESSGSLPDRNYLTVDAASSKANVQLIALIPTHNILANLPYLQQIIWFITVAALLTIPLGLILLRRWILTPLTRLIRAMKKVKSGDWSARVEMAASSNEFQLLGSSFNSMMTEIQTLRVNVFEEQLNKQREELQRLQLQVNPHFFLNSLNIVYNLAKVKNFELIQEMTVSLIRYFRFMFRSNTSFVKLEDELEHTRNYLRIQELRFRDRLTWNVEAPVYLTEVPVPPLLVQSFVENAVKHGVTLERPVHIEVRIGFQEDDRSGSRVHIRIRDTGQGFEPQVLEHLQAGRSIQNDRGEHTGIWNVERRIKLLYGDTASIQYRNDELGGGAVVDILLPASPESLANFG